MRTAIAALALVAIPAHADFNDGNKLLSAMEGSSSDKLYSLGYVAGVADAFNNLTFCMPNDIQLGQAHDVVHNYLKAYPNSRHYAADSLAAIALSDAWPCNKKSTVKKM